MFPFYVLFSRGESFSPRPGRSPAFLAPCFVQASALYRKLFLRPSGWLSAVSSFQTNRLNQFPKPEGRAYEKRVHRINSDVLEAPLSSL